MTKIEKVFLGITLTALVCFTFVDLQISQALFNQASLFGKFFETFGELPMALIGAFSAAALMVTAKKDSGWLYYVQLMGFGLLLALYSLMGSFLVGTYLKWSKPVLMIGFLVVLVGAYGLARAVPKKHQENLRQAAKVGLILAFAAVFVITIIKMFWGRLRFRSMVDPVKEFTLWFIPQGLTTDNEHMSFPSGHSANSAVIYWLTLLPTFIPVLKNKQAYLQIGTMMWFILVMISRVMMGAHFASDVTMGMLISISMFWLLRRKFMKDVDLLEN